MNCKVLVVDDNPILRRGVACLIEREQRFVLAGEAADGEEGALAFSRLRPDVVLLNLSSFEAAAVSGIEKIRALNSCAQIVNLSRWDHGEDIHDVLRAGAHGYIQLNASVDELVACILLVANGGRYLSPAAAAKVAAAAWADSLSRRELDILRLVSTGKSNRDIGRVAGIAEETVKSHVNKILSKLGVASRTEAVSVAVRRGVIRFA